MAEKEKKDDKKKIIHHSKGEISFGLEIILFIVAIFIIWVLTGGPKKESVSEGPFIDPSSVTPSFPTE